MFKLQSMNDFEKIVLIRNLALEHGSIYCISSDPEHECNEFHSENIVLVIYDSEFRPALQAILTDIFAQYGPGPYGMASNTSQDEFIQIKLGSCICGYNDF